MVRYLSVTPETGSKVLRTMWPRGGLGAAVASASGVEEGFAETGLRAYFVVIRVYGGRKGLSVPVR